MHPQRDLIQTASKVILNEQFYNAFARGAMRGASQNISNQLGNYGNVASGIGTAVANSVRNPFTLRNMTGYASTLLNPNNYWRGLGALAGDRRPAMTELETRMERQRDAIRDRADAQRRATFASMENDRRYSIGLAMDNADLKDRERARSNVSHQQELDLKRRIADQRLNRIAQQMGISREELATRSTPQALNTAQQQTASDDWARGASTGLQADLARAQQPTGTVSRPGTTTRVQDNSSATGVYVQRPGEVRARAAEAQREYERQQTRDRVASNTTTARARRYMEQDAAAERQDNSVDAQVSRFASASPEERAEMIRKANASLGSSRTSTGSTSTTGRRDTSRPTSSTTS